MEIESLLGQLTKAALGGGYNKTLSSLPKLVNAIPNQTNAIKAFMPVDNLESFAEGTIVGGRIKLSENLTVHGFVAGELDKNVAGIMYANYKGFDEGIGTDWSNYIDVNEVTLLSVEHGYGFADWLRRSILANPDSPDGEWPAPPQRSPFRTIVRHREEILPSINKHLKLMGRDKCVAEVSSNQHKYRSQLDFLGFGPVFERGGHEFREIDITKL